MNNLTQHVSKLKQLLNPSFTGDVKTPLTGKDIDEKEEALDYVKDYARADLRYVLQHFAHIQVPDTPLPNLTDIYQEGIQIEYVSDDVTKTVFVPFRMHKSTPIERLYYLVYEARLRHGLLDDITPSQDAKREYTIVNTEFVTPNMLRLYVKSNKPLPNNDPGYAYRFALTKLDSQDDTATDWRVKAISLLGAAENRLNAIPYGERLSQRIKQYGYLTAFEIIKRLPEKPQPNNSARPASLLEKRYYTLRQLLSNTDKHQGEVDIYIHAGSPGSEWATSLQAGDVIFSDFDYEETIKNMTIGQPLFICDETSMPTVAAMLERWDRDTAPIVIGITNDYADFAYFDEVNLPDALKNSLHIHHINAKQTDNLAQTVIDTIKQKGVKIDCAWGAIGKKDFKPIKKYLREEHGLTGKINRIRAYWS